MIKSSIKYLLEIGRGLFCACSDFLHYARHSSTYQVGSNEEKLQGLIIRNLHGLEVGMTYSPPRANFGSKVVNQLIAAVDKHLSASKPNEAVRTAIRTLENYLEFNHRLGSSNPQLEARIQSLREKVESSSEDASTIEIETGKCYDFQSIATSRRSCRSFAEGPVAQSLIEDAIETALTSPSACNRQPYRVYQLNDPGKREAALNIQNNSSTWRKTADKILVVTCDQRFYSGIRERHCCYIDGGLFCMSLVYALHSLGLGVCTLNLNLSLGLTSKLRRIVGARESENFIMMIAVGHPPSSLKVPRGRRRDTSEILKQV